MTYNPDYLRVPLMTKQPHVPIRHSPEFQHAVDFFHTPHVTVDRQARTPFKAVYCKYVDWCERLGYDRISKIYFTHAVAEHSIIFDAHASGRQRRLGVRLNHLEIPTR